LEGSKSSPATCDWTIIESSEVWDILNSLLQGDLGQAASMQSKAEEVPGKFQGGKLDPANDF